jgi:hypothetical protein
VTPEQQLIRLYRETATRLRAQIRADLTDGRIGTAIYRRRQLQAIRRELAALGRRTRATPIELVAAGYDRGAALVDVAMGRIGIREALNARYTFSGTHARAALVIARNLAGRVDDARELVGRRADDVYRQAALEIVGQGITAGDTRRDVSAALERRLIHDGVTGFVDRRGARWQLDTYAEMVARTTTREAMTAGTEARMIETGQDLITISAHGTECDICKQFEGKTYSISGDTPGYPRLVARPPFHPRCLHYATPAAANLEQVLRDLGIAMPA